VRTLVAVTVCLAAAVLTESPASTPTAVTTVACAQPGAFFNVQITGKLEGTFVGTFYRDMFARVPKRESIVTVWTFGSEATNGSFLYGWATSGRAISSSRCRPRTARPPAKGNLRAPIRVRDGWALTRRYECRQRGPILIRTDVRGATTRLTLWMERSRELVATAEIRDGSGWLRASKRCYERDR
jgi:hypothetical protein